ncbi:putative uncharacterized protein [Prevotella sp. CAG:474]|nr:putative uncharacterized protein [Prevotella sp. CAG:474]
MNVSRKRYIQGFCIAVVVLGMVRCIFPSVAGDMPRSAQTQTPIATTADSTEAADTAALLKGTLNAAPISQRTRFFNADGTPARNRIFSVPNFGNTFPDQNDVQVLSARKHGVSPVADEHEAERRKSELVYIGANPYFYTDRLHNSIPYLVPRASVLLQDIGRAFFDSLQTKGVPLHKIIVTSVLRSKKDVTHLRKRNSNATQNSCHMYGTTFDIAYNRYKTVEAPGERRRVVRNDTLKWILSEVLRDMRQNDRCWIKYEVHQGCFHITAK